MVRKTCDWLVYFVVRVFVCVVQSLTQETCRTLARWLGVLATDIVPLRRDVLEENLTRIFPQWDPRRRRAFVRDMWEHLFLMVCEVAQAPRKIHLTNWRDYFSVPQKEQLVRYLLDPRATVVISGHYGNFEIGGYMMGLFGFRSYAVARTLDNPYLDRFLNLFRAAHGQYLLPKQGSAVQIGAVLQRGDTLMLLGDQAAGERGCWIEFLGRPASCHKAVALFTLTSGAPMVVSYARRVGGPLRFEIGVAGVADPQLGGPHLAGTKPLTQWYSDRLAEIVLAAPEQYWWVHRRWKGEPPVRTKRKAA